MDLDAAFAELTKQDVVVMQSTGMHDKNRKEVYEDDIVKVWMATGMDNGHWIIRYLDRSFCIASEDDDTSMEFVWWNDIEVVGNIHENPDLTQKHQMINEFTVRILYSG